MQEHFRSLDDGVGRYLVKLDENRRPIFTDPGETPCVKESCLALEVHDDHVTIFLVINNMPFQVDCPI